MLLFELEEHIGEETFDGFLAALVEERVDSTEKLLDVLAGLADDDTARWFEAKLRE